ncbi:MAG: AMP-binding protein [Kocuria sp.]|nr:AMP-binding protein [Kocuria sp.]
MGSSNHMGASIEVRTARDEGIDAGLSRSAERWGSRPALAFGDRTWSYREFDDAVTDAARALRSHGYEDGARLAFFGKNSDAFLIAFFATLRAGYVHVPVNFALTGAELAHILEDSGASAVYTDPGLRDTALDVLDEVPAQSVRPLYGSEEGLLEQVLAGVGKEPRSRTRSDSIGAPAASADDVVQLLYTSGTTSKPKGAVHTHASLRAQYESCIMALSLDPEDAPLIAMPLYHSAALHVFAVPYLSIGASLRLIEKPDVPQILDLVERERIGSLFLAPTVWVPLANHPDLGRRDLSSLSKAQYGASIMPVAVLETLRAQYPEIGFYNCFGQSELGPLTCVLGPEEHDERPASCGKPVHNVRARIMTSDGLPARIGEPGEIQYRGPQVCTGYWNLPEDTAESFKDGWFRSGDQVVMDDGGFIEVVDRIKDVINTGGIVVASREIEDVIYRYDGVAEVAVVGTPDDRWIEAVTAFVVPKEGAALTSDGLLRHVREHLAPFKVPKRVEFVNELPRNQSGKILKRDLRSAASKGR